MTFVPCLVRSMDGPELVSITLGHPLVDGYLEFVGARGARNTWLAVAYDLKVFFEVIAKEPAEVTSADVFAFPAAQRAPHPVTLATGDSFGEIDAIAPHEPGTRDFSWPADGCWHEPDTYGSWQPNTQRRGTRSAARVPTPPFPSSMPLTFGSRPPRL